MSERIENNVRKGQKTLSEKDRKHCFEKIENNIGKDRKHCQKRIENIVRVTSTFSFSDHFLKNFFLQNVRSHNCVLKG